MARNATLLPSQISYLKTWDTRVKPNRFNGQYIIRLENDFSFEAFREAARLMVNNHQNFRVKMVRENGQWRQVFTPTIAELPIPTFDLSGLSTPDAYQQIRLIHRKHINGLDLQKGRVFDFCFYKTNEADKGRYVSIIVHHICFDFLTVKYALKELFSTYSRLMQGDTPVPPDEDNSIDEYVGALEHFTNTVLTNSEKEYWLSRPWDKVRPLPLNYLHRYKGNTLESRRSFSYTFQGDLLRAMRERLLRIRFFSVEELMTALISQALALWSGSEYVSLEVVHNGRQVLPREYGLSVRKTFGWFSVSRMLILPNFQLTDYPERLADVIGAQRNIPSDGIGYHLLQSYTRDGQLRDFLDDPDKQPQVVINSRGGSYVNEHRELEIMTELDDLYADPEAQNKTVLACDIVEKGDSCTLIWQYSINLHKEESIRSLCCLIQEIADGCLEYQLNAPVSAFSIDTRLVTV